MNDDTGLAKFLKARLEEGVNASPPRLESIMRAAADESIAQAARRRFRFRAWGASLIAASLAAACLFVLPDRIAPAPAERTVARVIDLLRASDGDIADASAESIAELLIAWQDAPYEKAISGIARDSMN